MNPRDLLHEALAHHRAGRLDAAEAGYRQILAVQPNHADALHLLGVVAHQTGHHAAALELIRQAIALNPNIADYHNNLGLALAAVNRPAEAEASYRHALRLRPKYADAYNNLGNVLRQRRSFPEAIAAYREAIALQAENLDPRLNLAGALLDDGKVDAAEAVCQEALELTPTNARLHNLLGCIRRRQERLPAAFEEFTTAARLDPAFAEPRNNLGAVLAAWRRYPEAEAEFSAAIALDPKYAEAYINRASFYSNLRRPEMALADCDRAVAWSPNFAGAHNDRGAALLDLGRLEEAMRAFDRAIELKPDFVEALNNRALVSMQQGRLEEAIATLREALRHRPDYSPAYSGLLFLLLNQPGHSAAELLAEHRGWDRTVAAPLKTEWRPHPNRRDPERRLRVGFVSGDLRDHAVGRNVLPLFQHHDREQFAFFGYSNHPEADAITARLRSHTDGWRVIAGADDREVAAWVREDEIDILVDLSLHTRHSRIAVFARKPAPVQVTFAGYPGTTGLEAIDYRLTDPYLDPPGERDELYSERSIRLPHSFWCFDPIDDRVEPTPRSNRGEPILWGCLNNPTKINDAGLALWARVLHATPDSRLVLLANNDYDPPRITAGFARQGIAASRFEFMAARPRAEYLALYNRCDAILDTVPYNGHTTTCDALWMGVPVISRAGEAVVSRAGFSLLSNIGLPDLVAFSDEAFVQIAVQLAHDRPRLATLHATLRSRMAASPLMDGAGFARGIDAAFRRMWRDWCAQPASPP